MVRKAVSCKPVDEGGKGASMPSDELFSKLQRCGETLSHIVNILHALFTRYSKRIFASSALENYQKDPQL